MVEDHEGDAEQEAGDVARREQTPDGTFAQAGEEDEVYPGRDDGRDAGRGRGDGGGVGL